MSPMTKRLPRQLKNNLGKYLGIFLLMFISIAFTSGFLLAASSISVIIGDMRSEYNIEDGRFTTNFEASAKQKNAFADAADSVGGVDIYDNYYVKADFKKGADDTDRARTIQTYTHRTEVDLAAYAEGNAPAAADEVAIDRVFATNNDVKLGDTILLEGKEFKVVGICTLAEHQALFANNSDFTVNTITFGVAEVTADGFQTLRDAGAAFSYNYSFCFKDRDLTLAERLDAEEDMLSALTDADATVSDFIDRDTNQGISYASNDIEGDSSMWSVLLYIIIAIMAFIFVVLTSATIEEESAIIGTLLASGYRRRELVAHYMILPTLVGVLACVGGTFAGIEIFTMPMKNLYYGSYSFPPYHTTFDWGIFTKCALVPLLVLVLITLFGLLRKIGHTPLQFLRHETSKGGIKRGFTLPERLSFTARFRIRVFLRNLGNFATLFLGITFAMLLLLFSLCILPTMNHYASNLVETTVAEHQYSLKAPLELEGTDEERQQWKDIDKLQDLDQAKLREIEDEADVLQDKADDLEARGDDLEARGDDLEARGNDLTSRGNALQARSNDLQSRASDLASRGSDFKNTYADFQSRVEALKSEATEALTAAGTDAATKAAAIEPAQKAVTDAQTALDNLKSLPEDQQDAAAIAEAQSALDSANTAAQAAQADAATAQQSYTALEASYKEKEAALTNEGTQLQNTYNSLTAEQNQLESEGNQLQAEATQLESEGNALQDEADALQNEADALQDEADALEAERDKLYEKIDELAAQIGVTRDEFEDMVDRIEGIDLDDDNLHPINTTDNGAAKIAQAEKYAVYSLEYDRGEGNGNESVTIYGIQEDSRYWKNVGVGSGKIVLGNGLVDKFSWAAGTEVSLFDKYEDKTYTVEYAGSNSYGTKSDMNIYMSLSDFNKFFGNDSLYFSGWASDEELKLDSRYLTSDLTPSDMEAIGDQFVGMMNDMIGMLVGLSMATFLIFMYLLTKSIIERSARSISYMKVFGYRDREVSKLYVRSITWVVVISVFLCLPLIIVSLTAIFRAMLLAYNGNIEIYAPVEVIAECIVAALVTYAVVALIHMRAIKKVPLSIALKVQE